MSVSLTPAGIGSINWLSPISSTRMRKAMSHARSSCVKEAPPEKENLDVRESASTRTLGSVSARFRFVLHVSGNAPVGASRDTCLANTSHRVAMAAPGHVMDELYLLLQS